MIALPRIKVQQAAELSGRAAQYIRIAMQRDLIDIGTAIKMPGSTKYYYDIRPQKLAEYLGISVKNMYEKLGISIDEFNENEQKGSGKMTIFIIVLLSFLAILSCWKWCEWKVLATTLLLFEIDKGYEPTNEETSYYTEMAIKKILGID